MGTAAFAVSETAPQGTLFRTDDKRKAERLPCDLNDQAAELFSRLVKQLDEREGVTEALKAENLQYHLFFHSRYDIISTNTNTFIER